jgi:hypothetical protein
MLMCYHTSTQPLTGGTDTFVPVRDHGQVRRILVRGFPALVCTDPACLTISTDLAWMLAVQDVLEQRLDSGVTVSPIVAFDDLQITQPATLCA